MSAFDDSIINDMSCVDNSDAILNMGFEIFSSQWLMGFFVCFIIQNIDSLLIEFSIMEEVFWWGRKIFSNLFNELVFISNQEGIIVLTLCF